MRRRLAALILIAAQASTTAEASTELPGWMAGCWEEKSAGRLTEECWMAPRGGGMLGASRSGAGERVTATENMRIDVDVPNGDGPTIRMAFSAVQRTGGWTMFVWDGDEAERSVTFTNRFHDYPQRIRYWREGEALLAEISLLDGSKAKRWRYTRAAM